jgi:hypothetical protein
MQGKKRNAHRIFAGKQEGNKPLGRPKRRWEKISKWILGEQDGEVWTRLIWLRIGASREFL